MQNPVSFTTLWIYTILKLGLAVNNRWNGFTTLWIYTILKPVAVSWCPPAVSLPYGFTLFSNTATQLNQIYQFHYLMDLHYSQTANQGAENGDSFTTLWIYTILKR